MDDVELKDFSEEAQTFIREMEYNEPQIALLGMGILLGEVGSAQYNAGIKNKPVLEKLNFQGMRPEKLKRLSSEIFAKLRQYKKLTYGNEKIFAGMKRLLDKHISSWDLSPQDNVFYILSGYAYQTNKILSSKSIDDNDDKNDDNEETSEDE